MANVFLVHNKYRLLSIKNTVFPYVRGNPLIACGVLAALAAFVWMAAGKIVSMSAANRRHDFTSGLIVLILVAISIVAGLGRTFQQMFASPENEYLRSLPIRPDGVIRLRCWERVIENTPYALFIIIVLIRFYGRVATPPGYRMLWLGTAALCPVIISAVQIAWAFGYRDAGTVLSAIKTRSKRQGQQDLYARVMPYFAWLPDTISGLIRKDIVLLTRNRMLGGGVALVSVILLFFLSLTLANNGALGSNALMMIAIASSAALFFWTLTVYDLSEAEIPFFWILHLLPVRRKDYWIAKFIFVMAVGMVLVAAALGLSATGGHHWTSVLLTAAGVLSANVLLSFFAVCFLFIFMPAHKMGAIVYSLFLMLAIFACIAFPVIVVALSPVGIWMYKRGTKE